jgi:hypothetical protein
VADGNKEPANRQKPYQKPYKINDAFDGAMKKISSAPAPKKKK